MNLYLHMYKHKSSDFHISAEMNSQVLLRRASHIASSAKSWRGTGQGTYTYVWWFEYALPMGSGNIRRYGLNGALLEKYVTLEAGP